MVLLTQNHLVTPYIPEWGTCSLFDCDLTLVRESIHRLFDAAVQLYFGVVSATTKVL